MEPLLAGRPDVTSAPTATYVYCVVRATAPPAADGAPPGLPDASPVRTLALPGADGDHPLWAVVADVPLPQYGAEEIERRLSELSWVSACAMAHEGVVEHFAARSSAVPMKLFTLFSNEDRATADLAARRDELERVLARVAGHVEWGLRVRFDAEKARRQAAAPGKDAGSPSPSGTDFLQRKQRERAGARAWASGAATAAEKTYEALTGQAREARRRNLAGASEAGLLLDAAFLVPQAEMEAFEKAVAAEAETLAAACCDVTLTGPWPPYNFVDEGP
jgi:hypothetical protein